MNTKSTTTTKGAKSTTTKGAKAPAFNPRGGLKSTTTKGAKAPAAKAPAAPVSFVSESMLARTTVAGTALAAVESSGVTAVLASEWTAFDAYVAGLATYARTFGAIWSATLTKAGVKYNAAAIVKAWQTPGNGAYVTPSARGGLPTRSTLERALIVGAAHNAARAKAFKACGNAPTIKDYAPYLTKVSGAARDGGNTKIDWTKGAKAGADAAKESGATVARDLAFKVTRKAPAGKAPAVETKVDPMVAAWGPMALLDDAALAAVPIVADIEIDPAALAAFARQMVAAAIIAARADGAKAPAAPAVKVTMRATA
jgi:hypothetical protein